MTIRVEGVVFCGLIFLSGCGILGPTMETVGLRPLIPLPTEYRAWYDEVQSCIGETREFDKIIFFVANELYLGGEEVGGVWSSPSRITMRRDHVLIQRAVKHEMIHYIYKDSTHTLMYALCSQAKGGSDD